MLIGPATIKFYAAIMSDNVIIRTQQLSKRFHQRWAVSQLNLQVAQGQIFGFLGPNGAGKSTTIRMLLSLLTPNTGHFELFGKNPLKSGKAVYRKIGALVEEPNFYLYISGKRNLQILGELSGGVSKQRIEEVLEIVELKGREKEKVKNYSHGMRQRLGIAQAILHQPELVILDEPTSGLDPEGIKEIRELIKALAEEKGITIFLSSHLLHEVEQVCSHMAIIDYGKLITQGAVKDLLQETNFSITEIKVNDPHQAMQLLLPKKWAREMSVSEDILKVQVALQDRPRLISYLIGEGLQIYSVIPRTSLEDYYLTLIERRHQE